MTIRDIPGQRRNHRGRKSKIKAIGHDDTRPGRGQVERREPPKMRRYERRDPATGRVTVVWSSRDPNAESKRSDAVQAPHIIGDNVEYQSMIDGSWITGKRQHKEHLRDNDCEEVGNERMPFEENARHQAHKRIKDTVGQDIKDAIDQIEAGYVHEPEPEPDELTPIEVSGDVETGDIIRDNVPQESTIIETV